MTRNRIFRLIPIAALAGALALSAAAAAAADAPVGPAFTVDEVTLPPAAAGPVLAGVRVKIELLAEESRTALNGQSADLVLDADCGQRRTRLGRVLVYRAAHQAGPASPASAPGDWLPFSSHAYVAQIAEAICARRGERAAAGAPAEEPARATVTAVARPPAAPADAPPRAPAPETASAPTTGRSAEPSPAPVAGLEVQFASSPHEEDVARRRSGSGLASRRS